MNELIKNNFHSIFKIHIKATIILHLIFSSKIKFLRKLLNYK
jgi:hypothetical protein